MLGNAGSEPDFFYPQALADAFIFDGKAGILWFFLAFVVW
jgi:hypothetical protein